MRLRAVVPATAANLGPGFDCFGMALDLCNEVMLDTDAEPGVTWEGEGADELPTDGTDGVSRAIGSAAQVRRRHHPDATLPRFALHGLNRIPLERGLGSSSAAAVAGTALASTLLGPAGWDHMGDPHTTFAYAAELEGHPDNAAPATYGGLTVIADGFVRRMDVDAAIRPVMLIPDGVRMPTGQARRALPERVPLRDAVHNVAHGALTMIALTTGDIELLQVALHDRLHEEARLSLVPSVRDVFHELQGSVPVCVSGSGPALLAFESGGSSVPHPGRGWRVLRPAPRRAGVAVMRE